MPFSACSHRRLPSLPFSFVGELRWFCAVPLQCVTESGRSRDVCCSCSDLRRPLHLEKTGVTTDGVPICSSCCFLLQGLPSAAPPKGHGKHATRFPCRQCFCALRCVCLRQLFRRCASSSDPFALPAKLVQTYWLRYSALDWCLCVRDPVLLRSCFGSCPIDIQIMNASACVLKPLNRAPLAPSVLPQFLVEAGFVPSVHSRIIGSVVCFSEDGQKRVCPDGVKCPQLWHLLWQQWQHDSVW